MDPDELEGTAPALAAKGEFVRLTTASAGEVLATMAGFVAGGAIGAPEGGLSGALVGAAATPFLQRWATTIAKELKRRGPILADAAAVSSGLPEVDVLVRVTSDPTLQPLVQRILEAVTHTSSEEKIRLLGTVLGEAIRDRPRKVDEDFLIVAAIDDIQPVHLRLMEVLEHPFDPKDSSLGWYDEAIREQVPSVSAVGCQAGLAGLVRHGLARSKTGFDVVVYEITEFGGLLLAVMRASSGNA